MIARRHLLGLLGVVPFMGTPQRPDQSYDPPVSGLAPSSQSGVFIGRRVVVFSSGTAFNGVFVYSPTPGLNNLVASITSASGTDPYGNTYQSGITSYIAGTSAYSRLQGAQVSLSDTSADTWLLGAATAGPTLQLTTPTGKHLFFRTDGTIAAESVTVPGQAETWQIVSAGSLAAGFAIGSTPIRYRKEPDNTVRLAGIVNLTASQTAPQTVFSVASGYFPAQNQFVVSANQLSGAVATQTIVEVTTAGAVQILENGVNGNTVSFDNITYPLD